MNAKTLGSIFSTIPTTVRFPWDAQVASHESKLEEILADGEDDGYTDDMLHDLIHGSVHAIAEDAPAHGETFSGLAGAGLGLGGVDLRRVELEALEAQAKLAHNQKLLDAIAAARLVSSAAAAASAKASRMPANKTTKRPRQGGNIDRSDPDVQKLDSMIEENSTMTSRWESNRDALTADEQELLLRVPGSEGREVHGAVCLFHHAKGYGFIAPNCGGPDIYFTREAVVFPDGSEDVLASNNNMSNSAAIGVGERVTFQVGLNDGHSTRRLKAENVCVVGNGGAPAIIAALKGRRFLGRVRNFNVDANRGYIQSNERALVDDIVATVGVNLHTLERCHVKGVIDAVFVLLQTQINSGITPANGAEVEYNLMPNLDLKTGRAVAVNCRFVSTPEALPTDEAGSDNRMQNATLGYSGPEGTMDEPFLKRVRPETMPSRGPLQVNPLAVATQQPTGTQSAPKLLLLDDGDGAW